jgi:hypothetical protein
MFFEKLVMSSFDNGDNHLEQPFGKLWIDFTKTEEFENLSTEQIISKQIEMKRR